jgi:putative SOS response-associated peptidase YedK
MCSQFELKVKARGLSKCLPGLHVSPLQIARMPEMNPRDQVLMLRAEADAYVAATARWGLMGSFLSLDPQVPVLSLRGEGLADMPFYGKIFRSKRCLVPATAFFTWHTQGRSEGRKLRLSHPAGDALLFAAVFDQHPQVGTSCALVTRDVGGRRLPVILNRLAASFWLADFADFPEFPAAAFSEILSLEAPALLSEVVPEPEISPQLAFRFA